MTETIDRRSVLKGAAMLGLYAAGAGESAAAAGLKFGPAEPFSFEDLKAMAKRMASEPYAGPKSVSPEILPKINYENWGKIKFDINLALFADGPGRFPVSFFHLGKYFQKPVQIYVVNQASAREVIYDPSYFDMPADSPARLLPQGAGFAGFRFQEARDGALDWRRNDWAVFLGGVFFRTIGELRQYGLSARAVAINVTLADRLEEFPDFTRLYVDQNGTGDSVTVYALIDSPSIAGACRFVLQRTKIVTMDIDQAFFLRRDVIRFGLAPVNSMFWFSETFKPTGTDWRPEVHDSDGLALWMGSGERAWRPLNDPPRIMASSFFDENPRGFGLLQRDRNFDHYQDGVFYDKRPSLWVEPKGAWGKGAVQLIEIPTGWEYDDNVVAMWVPAKPATAGTSVDLSYRLTWAADEPFPPSLARCVATRLGVGGQERLKGTWRFVVEFKGPPLEALPYGVKPEAVLWASRGTFLGTIIEAVPDEVPGHWRAQFDLVSSGSDPIEMRLFLRTGDKALTETWLYQFHPY